MRPGTVSSWRRVQQDVHLACFSFQASTQEEMIVRHLQPQPGHCCTGHIDEGREDIGQGIESPTENDVEYMRDAGSSPFEQAAEGGDHGQDSPMHTLEQARRTVTAFTDQNGLTEGGGGGAAAAPAARRQPSAALPDSPMMAGPAGGTMAAVFTPVRHSFGML